jgi:ZIP family zinc transporter
MNVTLTILLLSLAAGLGTGLGGLIAILRKPGQRSFGFLMGFAAGVMLTLSFLELVAEAWRLSGYLVATIGFGAGAFLMLLIDVITPHIRFGEAEADTADGRLLRTGMLMAIGISIHNIPEGTAVGAGYMHLPQFGVFIAVAIALHNVPEGIATALPLCKGGMCKRDSFRIAFLSGLVEPIGALAAALLLRSFHGLVPAALAFAGGVMVFLTLDELLPTAREHGHQHFTAIGIILGAMFVFLLSGALGV